MKEKRPLNYKDAGVDIDAASETKARIKNLVRATFNPQVLSDIGSFAGLYHLDTAKYKDPVLVSSTDGVGTKLKIAIMLNKHDTVGIDLVSHCVNDILVQGASPLFFLDYIGMGKHRPQLVEEIMRGLVLACQETGCVLIGGEMAEMPGFYGEGEYDLVGTIVGVVERERIINGSRISPGDVVVGLASNGLHTNGYSLARRILFEEMDLRVTDYIEELGMTLGEELLKPHRAYNKTILPLAEEFGIKGMAHITGGGFFGNIPRILPEGVKVIIRKGSWEVHPIFQLLQRMGRVEEKEMFRVFNMGIGMIVVVSEREANSLRVKLINKGERAFLIGEITEGKREVEII